MKVKAETLELTGLTVRHKTAPAPLVWSNVLGMEVCDKCFENAGG